MKAILFLRNIKKGFATNSSSYHSTVVLDQEEYDKWVAGEIAVEIRGDEQTYEEWQDDEYGETDVTTHTTPNGDSIVIICVHGSDY